MMNKKLGRLSMMAMAEPFDGESYHSRGNDVTRFVAGKIPLRHHQIM